jgi:hypothetical protein
MAIIKYDHIGAQTESVKHERTHNSSGKHLIEDRGRGREGAQKGAGKNEEEAGGGVEREEHGGGTRGKGAEGKEAPSIGLQIL